MKPKKQHPLDIALCNEVQIHYKRPLYDKEQRIASSMATENLLRDFVDTNRLDYKEFFWVILLSNANQVLGVSEISIGNTNGTYVNYKEIAQLALLTNATGVIIAHNHPSGVLKASHSDHSTTKNLKKSLDTLHIKLLDHIILTTESYVSFADEGWL
ncbi:JAB domain-containing protein [uncultured Dokdonia sp.]|uniref:JAB domain-containing protein n=1 Tax=uncultured Dokdonia sp. TaxID=575653 RepID=UPI002611FCB0|nr:JAB domain-containing protein [uncultured Dokdonia sp.]